MENSTIPIPVSSTGDKRSPKIIHASRVVEIDTSAVDKDVIMPSTR